jgi:ABC-type transport system substrate-binding protein
VKKKPLLKFLIALCLAAVLVVPTFLASCCGGTSKEGRLVIGITSNPNEFAPMKAEKLVQATLFGLIYEPLILKKEDGSIIPWLAESWDVSTNKMEYTFHLDPRAKYSNGTAVTADDVKYAFDVGLRHASQDHFAQTKAAWAQLSSVTVVDARTVKFTLSEAFGTFLDTVNSVLIFPKSLWTSKEDTPSKWNADPALSTFDATKLYQYNPANDAERRAMLIGSGPMKFYEYVADQWFWMVRNDDYWQGKVNVTEVVCNIYGSGESSLTALKMGEIDALVDIETPSQVTVLKQALDDNIEVDILTAFNHSTMFMLNMRKAPFNILNVRKAIDKAIDRQDLITFAQSGYATMPQNAPFAPGLVDSHTNLAWNPTNKTHAALVAEANTLLDAVPGMTTIAGGDGTYRKYDKGDGNGAQLMEFKCMYIETSTGYEKGVQLAQGDLAEIGIKIVPQPVQSNVLGPTLFSGYQIWNYDIAFFGYGGGPEFENLVRQWGNEPYAGNYDGSVVGWCNDPAEDDLTKAGNGGRPMTYDTPNWATATAAEKAHYAAVYTQLVTDSAPMIAACQATRRLTVGSAEYHAKALEIQEMFQAQLPVLIMYHGQFMTAYRTDRWTGWGDPDQGGPQSIYLYGMAVPTMSILTIMDLEAV